MNDAQLVVIDQQASATATILVIDEQLLMSSALAHALRDKGFDARCLRVSGLKAVQAAASGYLPGLVLLDLDLGPRAGDQPLAGVDLIGPLCAQGWTVMVITGTSSPSRIADATAHGAASWIGKGATFAEVVHAAVEVMQEHGQARPAAVGGRWQASAGDDRKPLERQRACIAPA